MGWNNFDTGDVGGVTAGFGLTGGGDRGIVTLRADSSVLRVRVIGTCAVGSSIRVININGTVVCQSTNAGGTSGTDSLTFEAMLREQAALIEVLQGQIRQFQAQLDALEERN